MESEEKSPFNERQGAIPISEAIRDAQTGFRDLLRSELHLASVELKTALLSLGHRSKLLVGFAGLALWAVFPFTAFLVLALGALLGGNYWLSSLVLGVLALGIGTFGILRQVRKAKEEDLSLSRTRRTINRKLRRVV